MDSAHDVENKLEDIRDKLDDLKKRVQPLLARFQKTIGDDLILLQGMVQDRIRDVLRAVGCQIEEIIIRRHTGWDKAAMKDNKIGNRRAVERNKRGVLSDELRGRILADMDLLITDDVKVGIECLKSLIDDDVIRDPRISAAEDTLLETWLSQKVSAAHVDNARAAIALWRTLKQQQ